MQVLILGGNPGSVATWQERLWPPANEVTCLARGMSGQVPAGVAFVRADRDQPGAYAPVATERWDVVIDVASQPGRVRHATKALESRSERSVFVSSASVYADHHAGGPGREGPLLDALDGEVMETIRTYGQAKVACERHVLDTFGPDRSQIARVGLIRGRGHLRPHRLLAAAFLSASPSGWDRLGARRPGESAQVIDLRDLARWLVVAPGQGY